MTSGPRVLVLNGGSTSIKVAHFGAAAGAAASRRVTLDLDASHGLDAALDWIDAEVGWDQIDAVGHRVVHGGEKHTAPCRVTEAVMNDLRALSPYDPAHLPLEIALMEGVARRRPELVQVACFDTAFHRTLPTVARLLPLPRRLYERGVRRYGFHGLSYEYLVAEIERQSGTAAAHGRMVLAHLGGGASLAAVRNGASIDTTMGFTPTAGIPMGTRSGDIDPGVIAFLARTEGMTAERFTQMTTDESGLLGVSGISASLRELTARSKTEPHAAEAIELFCYEIKKRVGGFAAALGGLDRLVFTGGIGEHAADVRARICDGLGFLGVVLDPARNAAHAKTISSSDAPVVVQVIPTDEERMIVEGVMRVFSAKNESER